MAGSLDQKFSVTQLKVAIEASLVLVICFGSCTAVRGRPSLSALDVVFFLGSVTNTS